MKEFTQDNCGLIYEFSRDSKASGTVEQGELFCVHCIDCYGGMLQREEDLAKLAHQFQNPATGPIAVRGAEPGDLLRVDIKRIETEEQGIVTAGKACGLFSELTAPESVRFLEIKDGHFSFLGKSYAIHPMIGVIGLAPEFGRIACPLPGNHGGNMDDAMIGEGTRLFLPVAQPGGLLAMGDLHARMGDGETGGTGLEIAGRVYASCNIVKGESFSSPFLEDASYFSAIASAESMDQALSDAVDNMHRVLSPHMEMAANDLAMLLSLIGDAGVCQQVNKLKTARFRIAKDELPPLPFLCQEEN